MLQHQPFSPIPQPTLATLPACFPSSYRQFLQKYGAGYFTRTRIATVEPTRDGLDYVLLQGIAGTSGNEALPTLSTLAQENSYELPSYLIPFFADGPKLFCLDYKDGLSVEPRIRFIDTQTDQWLVIAPTFASLLDQLHPNEEAFDEWRPIAPTVHEANQFFGAAVQPEELSRLFQYFQDTPHKNWLFIWILHFLHHPSKQLADVAQEHLSFQLDFFHHSVVTQVDPALLQQCGVVD